VSNYHSNRTCEVSARECVHLARLTDDPDLRNELFKMARDWMAVAMQEQQEQADEPTTEAAWQGCLGRFTTARGRFVDTANKGHPARRSGRFGSAHERDALK
jgi:hypothetical protein